MNDSMSELGEALLQDPLANVNNSARLLAAIRPDAEAVRKAGLLLVAARLYCAAAGKRAYVMLASQASTGSVVLQEDVLAALLALQVFFLDASERGCLVKTVRALPCTSLSVYAAHATALCVALCVLCVSAKCCGARRRARPWRALLRPPTSSG